MRPTRVVLRLLPLYGLWLLLEQRLLVPELLVGVGVAAFAALLEAATRDPAGPRLRPRVADLRPALGLPWKVLRDSGRIARLVARSLARGERAEGAYRRIAFVAGGDADEAATRRALAVGYASFSPGSFVARIDGGAMLVHDLPATEEEPSGASLGRP